MEKLLNKRQKIRFSGAGASRQNGAAECTMKMVVNMTRNMLMYADIDVDFLVYPIFAESNY